MKFSEVIIKIMQKLSSSFYEDESKWWSAIRIAFLYSIIIGHGVVFGSLGYLVVVNQHFPEVPTSVLVLYGMATGMSLGAKLNQKTKELKAQLEEQTLGVKNALSGFNSTNDVEKVTSEPVQN